jgi:D-beta-D-heptose 7-phosphate kinase / D-beta-D-heptose 1-phosphate adenosyltransferase
MKKCWWKMEREEICMKDHLKNLIEKFKSIKVLVIGDAILDTYIKGSTDRICREAPVPVINVIEHEHDCGGAANTAINVSALGAETYFLSVIGRDESGKQLLNVLRKNKVNIKYTIRDKERTTIAKKRITASSSILLRIDDGDTSPISKEMQCELNSILKDIYKSVDAIIISDYGYGIVNETLILTLQKLRENNPNILVIDSKDLYRFKELYPTAVKPNYEESIRLLQLPKLLDNQRIKQISSNGKKLFDITGAKYIAATMDVEGTVLFEDGKKISRAFSIPQDHRKAIGAGDTFISAITLALCSGASAQQAVEIASAASAIVIQKDGTVVCTLNELKLHFNENQKYSFNLEDLKRKAQEIKNEGKQIVFTNGCFDILHRGHVNFLNKAKDFGDVLIVGINSDKSISRIKGKDRPINSLEDRIAVLAALHQITYLISFDEDTPEEIIRALKPDVFVKGGNYTVDSIPEASLVKQLGGEVRIIPFALKRSTTQLIKRIRETGEKKNGLKKEKNEYPKTRRME